MSDRVKGVFIKGTEKANAPHAPEPLRGTPQPPESVVRVTPKTGPCWHCEILQAEKQNLRQCLADARVDVKRYRDALVDAVEGLEEMSSYVDEYFREKWNHDEYIDRAKAVLEEL